MVKVTFRPWKEVIIHESVKYSFGDLINLCSTGLQPGALAPPLRWAEGVIFRISGMSPSDEVVRENLEGKVHWNSVEWALMPEYKNVILIDEINAKIPVTDVSANAVLREVARVLKG